MQAREGSNWEDPVQWRLEEALGRRRAVQSTYSRSEFGDERERKEQLWLGQSRQGPWALDWALHLILSVPGCPGWVLGRGTAEGVKGMACAGIRWLWRRDGSECCRCSGLSTSYYYFGWQVLGCEVCISLQVLLQAEKAILTLC